MHTLSRLVALTLGAATLAAQPQALTTQFAANNGGSSGWVVMFDASVTNAAGIRITGLDVNCSAAPATPVTVNVWLTPGTYVGNERNAAVWTLVSTGTSLGAARNTPAFADVGDFELAPGTWGLAVQTVGVGQAYTGSVAQTYSDANLTLNLGASLSTQFLSTGSLFSPRVWNGTVYYAARGDATYGVLGTGCAGSNGTPLLAPAANSLPSVGQTLTLDLTNGPTSPTAAVVALGFGKTTAFGLPLPVDLGVVGMTGCQLWIDPLVYSNIGVVNGVGTYAQPVPNQVSLFGLPIYHQAFVLDPPANPTGLVATNAGEGLIGR